MINIIHDIRRSGTQWRIPQAQLHRLGDDVYCYRKTGKSGRYDIYAAAYCPEDRLTRVLHYVGTVAREGSYWRDLAGDGAALCTARGPLAQIMVYNWLQQQKKELHQPKNPLVSALVNALVRTMAPDSTDRAAHDRVLGILTAKTHRRAIEALAKEVE